MRTNLELMEDVLTALALTNEGIRGTNEIYATTLFADPEILELYAQAERNYSVTLITLHELIQREKTRQNTPLTKR